MVPVSGEHIRDRHAELINELQQVWGISSRINKQRLTTPRQDPHIVIHIADGGVGQAGGVDRRRRTRKAHSLNLTGRR